MAIGNPRPDQCHGAFIVLQQKGAHQSTGISSRLISRGHPLPPPDPSRSQQPLGRPPFAAERASLSLAFSDLRVLHSFFQPLDDRHPSSGGGCRGGIGGGRCRRRWQIAGRRSAAAVVMKTYEIYSIWADAITPPTADNPRRPSPPCRPCPPTPRGYTRAHERGVSCGRCARVYVRLCVFVYVARRPEDCALALSTDAPQPREFYQDDRGGELAMNASSGLGKSWSWEFTRTSRRYWRRRESRWYIGIIGMRSVDGWSELSGEETRRARFTCSRRCFPALERGFEFRGISRDPEKAGTLAASSHVVKRGRECSMHSTSSPIGSARPSLA